MAKPKIIVFASGTEHGGGSGFENLVTHSRGGDLDADIVGVISNHETGGVRERADRLGIPFTYYPGPYTAEAYRKVARDGEWFALSGWLKMVRGLDPARTFNIHPALLSLGFGGPGMYGDHVHQAVHTALALGTIRESGASMHFVTDEYDRGPVFFEKQVPINIEMSPKAIAEAVNAIEHAYQPMITNLVVHGGIAWDGKDPESLVVPVDYQYLPEN